MPEKQPGWHLPFGTNFGVQIHYYPLDAAVISFVPMPIHKILAPELSIYFVTSITFWSETSFGWFLQGCMFYSS